MVLNPRIIHKLDSFEAPKDIVNILKYILEFQDSSDLENLSNRTTIQTYEKIIEQYASKPEIIEFCEKYREKYGGVNK